MKRNILIFLSTVFLSLLVAPIINIITVPSRDAIKWKEKSFLYNMDFVSRWTALILYPLGISTDPKQVIVGRDGWLFLGDQYDETLTVDRRPPSKADIDLGHRIGSATEAWDAYLSSKGVKLFKVMIGPNKGSIYPEHLPFWAKPSIPNATDALLTGTGAAHYIDVRGALLAAKANHSEALYYKTDTHWNFLGAGIAFQAFAEQVSLAAPEIRWPPQKAYELNRVNPRGGGDLANFLRLTEYLSDYEPLIHASTPSIESTQIDFDTKKVLHQSHSPYKPVLVKSVGALNNKKVLWFRDSFGGAMLPLMTATFSEVLHLHWSESINPGGRLIQLVEEWKPDYVFFTVVERASRNPMFALHPPPVIVPMGNKFKPIRAMTIVGKNHLLQRGKNDNFQIIGNDPFVDLAVSEVIKPKEVNYLGFDLTCTDGSLSVPLQLFWLEDGQQYFDEEHSAKLLFRTGQNSIDLRTLPKWSSATTIRRIRLDIDAQNSCVHFKLDNPSLGT